MQQNAKPLISKTPPPPQTTGNNTPHKGALKPVQGLSLRQAASRIFSAIIDKKISLDGLLDQQNGYPHYLALSQKDRTLCRAILQASLRHYMGIERQINDYLTNPLPKNAKALGHLLHIGAAQLLYLRIPSHAAIFLAVAQAKKDPRLKRFAGLVNAILRKFDQDGEKYPLTKQPLQQVPTWFRTMLCEDYGKEKAEKIIIAQSYLPNLDIELKSSTPLLQKEWAEKLNALVLTGGSLRLKDPQTDITALPGFAEGEWFVQNCAASFPVKIMGSIQDKKVVDLCAAPGGKTAQLAALGAKVTAIDNVSTRLSRLEKNMKRLNLRVKTWLGNFQDYPEKESFDIALLDAPCSSTGTIRRHLDVLWTKSLEDIEALANLQKILLHQAFSLVKNNGMLVFSNCSLAFAEGEKLVERFLKAEPTAKLLPITAKDFPQFAPFINKKGCLRTTPDCLPHECAKLGGLDGFFAARFVKQI